MDIGFKDIKEIVEQGMSEGEQFISLGSEEGNFQVIQIGSGSKSFKADQQGIWLGADTFTDAPFKVDMEGNLSITATEDASDTAIRLYDTDGNLAILIGF